MGAIALAGASEQGGSLSVLRSYGPALTHVGVVASSSHARAGFVNDKELINETG